MGLLTCWAADGDDAATSGAQEGQQPLGELQRAEEVHLHAGTEVAQWRELSVGNDVVETGVVHQAPETCGRGGALKNGIAPCWGALDGSPVHGSPMWGASRQTLWHGQGGGP